MSRAISKALSLAIGVGPSVCHACGGPVPWAAITMSIGLWGKEYPSCAFCTDCGQPRDWFTGEPRGTRSEEQRGARIVLDLDDLESVIDLAGTRAGRCGDKEAEAALHSALHALKSNQGGDASEWPEGVREIAEPWLGEPPDGLWRDAQAN